jgi:soluble lytic murein transglycosylase
MSTRTHAATRRPATRRRSPATRRAVRRRRLRLGVGVAVVALVALLVSRPSLHDAVQEIALPLRHEDIIRQQAAEKGVPADLIAAVIYEESRFSDQTSSAGARGLMQLTPDTADVIERLSGGTTFTYEDLANPDINIRYGTYYLNHLLDRYGGNLTAALAAYNAGPTNVDAWGGAELEIEDIEFPETQAYVENVLERQQEYRQNYGDELGL